MSTFAIKITSAIAIDGEVKRAGTIVTVDEELAKSLLHRGKAELATEDDGAVDVANVAGGTDADAPEVQKPSGKHKK